MKTISRLIISLVIVLLARPSYSQSLHEAAVRGEIEKLAQLLQKNPEAVNALSEEGYTALMMAVIWGQKNQTEVMGLLLDKGADINLANASGKTALHMAAEYASPAIVEWLLAKNADPFRRDGKARYPFHYAVFRGDKAIAEKLFRPELDLEPDSEDVPRLLHRAAACGYVSFVNLLLEKGVDLGLARPDGGSILHSAVEGGLVDLLGKGLRAGLKPDQRNVYGQTPLQLAAGLGRIEAVRALLEGGAAVAVRDYVGRTAYHLAKMENRADVLELLARHGAQESAVPFEVSGPYFGQRPPGLTPEIFAPGIISTAKGFEFAGVFTPDGREYYFTQRGFDFGQKIRYMRMENGKWTPPSFAPFTYEAFEFEPAIAPDGNKLYYGSRRPLPGKNELNPGADIWMVSRLEGGWGQPQYVGPDMMYVSVSRTGTLYFTGQAKNSKGRGIVKREFRNGQLAEAEDLGENVNFMPLTAHPLYRSRGTLPYF
jgi:ankyrin repeat protein